MIFTTTRVHKFHLPTQPQRRCQRALIVCGAEGGKSDEDSEARLAELERRARQGKGPQLMSPSVPQSDSNMKQVVWKEGQLLPEGWEQMDPLEKATQLYIGERGVLFWLNKAAFASVFIMGGLWIVFRFIGPAVGLYELSNGPVSP